MVRITGFVVSTPDLESTAAAWKRLGVSGIEVVPGEAALTAVKLAVEDVAATSRLLERRGLTVQDGDVDLGGTTWRLVEDAEVTETGLRLDHVVVRSADAVRATADFGGRLGLDLRLDRDTDFGFRGLFFRCGGAVVEVVVPHDAHEGPDTFGGLAWRCDVAATRERLIADGVEVSEVRQGRKPGTCVATVRDHDLAVPTLLVGPVTPS